MKISNLIKAIGGVFFIPLFVNSIFASGQVEKDEPRQTIEVAHELQLPTTIRGWNDYFDDLARDIKALKQSGVGDPQKILDRYRTGENGLFEWALRKQVGFKRFFGLNRGSPYERRVWPYLNWQWLIPLSFSGASLASYVSVYSAGHEQLGLGLIAGFGLASIGSSIVTALKHHRRYSDYIARVERRRFDIARKRLEKNFHPIMSEFYNDLNSLGIPRLDSLADIGVTLSPQTREFSRRPSPDLAQGAEALESLILSCRRK